MRASLGFRSAIVCCFQLFFGLSVGIGLYCSTARGELSLVQQPGPILVSGDAYEATVANDGCLTNLKIDGEEFLAPGVNISRGSYFYHNGPVALANVRREGNNRVLADCDVASIRYEFSSTGMRWTVANKTADSMAFFLVFAPEVNAAADDEGTFHKLPVTKNWPASTWFRKTARLEISGADRQWGPWQTEHQIWEATLKPNESRDIVFNIGAAKPSELSKIEELLQPKLGSSEVTLLSPREYQVFQRHQRTQGMVRVSGRTRLDVDGARIRFHGQALECELSEAWHTVSVADTGQFHEDLAISAGGWYRAELQLLQDGKTIHTETLDHVGVGEVFVGAGQSNSTNSGQFKTQQSSGMVSSFGGDRWKLADDPQLGVADNSQGGSFWPALGDAMYAKFRVPIGVATTGYGGTSVNQWHPEKELFAWTMTRVHQLGPSGFRALLWHQGETDVQMDSDEYYQKLRHVIETSKQQAGWDIPWYVAQVSYHNVDRPSFASTRSAHAKLWKDKVAGRGPDTDLLTGDHRDLDGKGIHFSPKGLKAHGKMWAERLIPFVEQMDAE